MLSLVLRLALVLGALAGFTACVHTPVTLTVAQAFSGGPVVDKAPLNPALRYLRVSVQGRSALLVLGFEEPLAAGPIQTWYSSEGEVLRLQNGRIVGTAGMSVDWRQVQHTPFPVWAEIGNTEGVSFERLRDEMPGYRYGIVESLRIRAIAPPSNAQLVGLPPEALQWYEERVVGHRQATGRYGVRVQDGLMTVVYGEQCLAADFCLAWQTWPPAP